MTLLHALQLVLGLLDRLHEAPTFVADWYGTLLGLAGVDPTDARAARAQARAANALGSCIAAALTKLPLEGVEWRFSYAGTAHTGCPESTRPEKLRPSSDTCPTTPCLGTGAGSFSSKLL